MRGCEVRSSASSTGSTTPKVRIWGGLSERERHRLRGADAPGASRRRCGLTLSRSPPADLPPVLRSGSTQRPAGLRWWRRAAALHARNASSSAELGRGNEAENSTRSSGPRGLDQRLTSVPADSIPVALGRPGSSTPGPARATRGAGRRPNPLGRRRAQRSRGPTRRASASSAPTRSQSRPQDSRAPDATAPSWGRLWRPASVGRRTKGVRGRIRAGSGAAGRPALEGRRARQAPRRSRTRTGGRRPGVGARGERRLRPRRVEVDERHHVDRARRGCSPRATGGAPTRRPSGPPSARLLRGAGSGGEREVAAVWSGSTWTSSSDGPAAAASSATTSVRRPSRLDHALHTAPSWGRRRLGPMRFGLALPQYDYSVPWNRPCAGRPCCATRRGPRARLRLLCSPFTSSSTSPVRRSTEAAGAYVPLVTLARAAGTPPRPRLGTPCCARPCVGHLLAKAARHHDRITGGRLEWGLGAGWYEPEPGVGMEIGPAGERNRPPGRGRPGLPAMLQSGGDPADFDGRFTGPGAPGTSHHRPGAQPAVFVAERRPPAALVAEHADG